MNHNREAILLRGFKNEPKHVDTSRADDYFLANNDLSWLEWYASTRPRQVQGKFGYPDVHWHLH